VLLAGAFAWCTWLAWRIAGRWSGGVRRIAAAAGTALAAGASAFCWVLLFWVW
jgi:hypothetical protein